MLRKDWLILCSANKYCLLWIWISHSLKQTGEILKPMGTSNIQLVSVRQSYDADNNITLFDVLLTGPSDTERISGEPLVEGEKHSTDNASKFIGILP